MAIQSPSFQQKDWIAALPSSYAKASEDRSVARNDEDGATRDSFHRAVGISLWHGPWALPTFLPRRLNDNMPVLKGQAVRAFLFQCRFVDHDWCGAVA